MKGLVDHIHSLGLKAGIYSSPGPTTCQGLGATWQHEEQDAAAYARWGFDYLKYDWCGYSQIAPKPTLEDRKKPYKLMGDILKKQPRDIVFSICQYGAGNVWEWGKEVGGHLWRMTGDIRDNWPSMTSIGFQQTGREQYAGPGGWNDTDMLVVGMVGWSQGTRPTDLTPNEQLTHMALWALQAAPLLIGADLSKIDDWTTNILGNREMLAVNQDVLGKPAGRKMSDGWVEVWARPLEDGTIAVGPVQSRPGSGDGDGDVGGSRPDRRAAGARPLAAEGPRPHGQAVLGDGAAARRAVREDRDAEVEVEKAVGSLFTFYVKSARRFSALDPGTIPASRVERQECAPCVCSQLDSS